MHNKYIVEYNLLHVSPQRMFGLFRLLSEKAIPFSDINSPHHHFCKTDNLIIINTCKKRGPIIIFARGASRRFVPNPCTASAGCV